MNWVLGLTEHTASWQNWRRAFGFQALQTVRRINGHNYYLGLNLILGINPVVLSAGGTTQQGACGEIALQWHAEWGHDWHWESRPGKAGVVQSSAQCCTRKLSLISCKPLNVFLYIYIGDNLLRIIQASVSTPFTYKHKSACTVLTCDGFFRCITTM